MLYKLRICKTIIIAIPLKWYFMENSFKVYPQHHQAPNIQYLPPQTSPTTQPDPSSVRQAQTPQRSGEFIIHVHQPSQALVQPSQTHHPNKPQPTTKRTREVSFRQPENQMFQSLVVSPKQHIPQPNAGDQELIQPTYLKEQNTPRLKLIGIEPKYYGDLAYVTDLMTFLSTPVQSAKGYIFNIHTIKQDVEYSITFDANIQMIRCYCSSQLYFFQNSDGPVFCFKQVKTNLFLTQFEPFQKQPSSRVMIAYQKSTKNKRAFLNAQIFRLYPQDNHPPDNYNLPTLNQFKIKGKLQFATRRPAVQSGNTPKLQINVGNRKQLLKGNRPSQYHCLIQDRHKNDVCLLLEKDDCYKIWVRSPMTPLQAICCGVSRIHRIKKVNNPSS